MPTPIPLLCDRCRAEGPAGEDPFAQYAHLLDFEPVPRRPRADGWDAEAQRAFIAALAATGSPRQAAAAVGKAQFGAGQLRKAKGNEGFIAAWERAIAFFAEDRSRRLAEGLGTVATAAAYCRPPRPAWAGAATRREALALPALGEADAAAQAEQDGLDWLERLLHKYALKVEQERKARLGGEIVAADFYLRQLTFIEVLLDLGGTDGLRLLREHRECGRRLLDIAETPMSRLLGEARRMQWAALGDPPRPEHPPRHYLDDHGHFSTEPLESAKGGQALSAEEQFARFKERHARDAEQQILWEAEARADFERRQSQSSPDSDPGSRPLRKARKPTRAGEAP